MGIDAGTCLQQQWVEVKGIAGCMQRSIEVGLEKGKLPFYFADSRASKHD